MKTLKWMIPFNCPLPKYAPHPVEVGTRERWNRVTTTLKPSNGSIIASLLSKIKLACAVDGLSSQPKPRWEGFRKERRMQLQQTQLLHHEASVPFAVIQSCKIRESSVALRLYWLVLVNETLGYEVSTFGPPRDKVLILLYSGQHYDVLTSLPGLFAISLFCDWWMDGQMDDGRTYMSSLILKQCETQVVMFQTC